MWDINLIQDNSKSSCLHGYFEELLLLCRGKQAWWALSYRFEISCDNALMSRYNARSETLSKVHNVYLIVHGKEF